MNTIIQFLQIGGIGAIIVRLFFSKYFEEKGKNLATKEDLKEITEIAENVKLELQHSFSQLSSWNTENKITILNYFDEYSYWINHSIQNISVVQNHPSSPQKIREVIKELNEQTAKVSKLFWRVCLFETDQKFINSLTLIYVNADNFQKLTLNFLLELELLAIRAEVHGNAKQIPEVKEIVKRRDATIDLFVEKRDKQEAIVFKDLVPLMDLIRNKIKNLGNAIKPS